MPDGLTLDLIGGALAWLLTIMILSYLVGDNPLFRLATYMFIGVASGYAGAIAWHNVLEPGLVDPLLDLGLGALTDFTLVIPWILILLLLLKLSPSTARYGSLPVALLVGVGAAVVVGGAITGTLLPQTVAAMDTLSPGAVSPQTGETGLERMANVSILLIGTVSTLLYFRFTARRTETGEARRNRLLAPLAMVGRWFIALTFGVMYAGALAATLVIFSERVQFLVDFVLDLFSGS